MAYPQKIVESGLHPKAEPTLDAKVLELTEQICIAFIGTVKESVLKIKEAERTAIARLNEYVPTEPLMDSKQAAAYLRIPLRTLHLMTSPSNIVLPFNRVGDRKRFRKAQLDSWLERNEVKPKGVKL